MKLTDKSEAKRCPGGGVQAKAAGRDSRLVIA